MPARYRPLTALLRRDPDFLELLIGDAVTEGTARVIAGVCDGDLQPIFEVIEDPAADEFVRCQMIDALVMIARHRSETRPEVTDYLERFFASEIEKPETLWGSCAFAVADLGLEHLEPQVRQAFEQHGSRLMRRTSTSSASSCARRWRAASRPRSTEAETAG